MKKNLIIGLISLLSISFCTAQMKSVRTTEEEYNYMIKGYPMQISAGLDMKKGYMLGKTQSIKYASYSFDYLPLQKMGTDTVFVGYIVKAHSSNWGGNTYWFCIPYGNEDLLNSTFNAVGNLDLPMSQAFFKSYVWLQTHL